MEHKQGGHAAHRRELPPSEPSRDPVCGMSVDPASTSLTESSGGRAYYFCSQHCLEKFRSEPDRYVVPPPAPSRAMASVPLRLRLSTRVRCIPKSSSQDLALVRSAEWP